MQSTAYPIGFPTTHVSHNIIINLIEVGAQLLSIDIGEPVRYRASDPRRRRCQVVPVNGALPFVLVCLICLGVLDVSWCA
jgi:hypothetical protein